jgi:molybdate/tungstate transport system permease protein
MDRPNNIHAFSNFSLVLHLVSGVILLFILAPLVSLLVDTPFATLVETAQNDEVRRSIGLSIWAAMAATLLSGISAIPLAYVLARKTFRLKPVVSGLVDLPIVIPHAAAGIALLGLFAGDGWFGRLGTSVVGTPVGIVCAMAFVSVPFLINSARQGFEAVPVRLEKAALNLGASPTRVFATISLPLAKRSIASGVVLMWARGMSEFGAVIFIAYNPKVAPILLWEWFGSYGLDYARPVAVLLIAVSLVFFVALRFLTSGGGDAER